VVQQKIKNREEKEHLLNRATQQLKERLEVLKETAKIVIDSRSPQQKMASLLSQINWQKNHRDMLQHSIAQGNIKLIQYGNENRSLLDQYNYVHYEYAYLINKFNNKQDEILELIKGQLPTANERFNLVNNF